MFGRIVNQVRRKLSVPLKGEVSKNSWSNLIKIHNERKTQQMSEYDRGKYQQVTDPRDLNHCVLRVDYISNSTTIEDLANLFPNASMIILEKSRSSKAKVAFIGYENETDCIKSFLNDNELEIRNIPILVTFAEVNIEKKRIIKEKKMEEMKSGSPLKETLSNGFVPTQNNTKT